MKISQRTVLEKCTDSAQVFRWQTTTQHTHLTWTYAIAMNSDYSIVADTNKLLDQTSSLQQPRYCKQKNKCKKYKTSAIISVNAFYCRFPFIYTIQGLDLFLDLLGDLSFSESVVESSVDIFQVSASASTWGSSSLGLGGPVEL